MRSPLPAYAANPRASIRTAGWSCCPWGERVVPPRALQPPDSARAVFGHALPLAQAYAALLASAGVDRGIIGPSEAERIWDRHLLNCAVLATLIPRSCLLADLGSGA